MRRASCLNTSIIQIPAVEFFHGSGTPTPPADRLVTTGAPPETDHQVHTPARLQPGKLLDGPAPSHLAPRRNFHVFTPNGRKSSRQLTSINRLPDFNRWPRAASPAPRLQQETRPVSSLDSHDTRRQPPLLSLIGCAHATPTSCICLYLTLNNPLLQALPRAFTPSPPRLRRRCRAKWRPPRPPSSERLTRPRRQPTFRCRACTVE